MPQLGPEGLAQIGEPNGLSACAHLDVVDIGWDERVADLTWRGGISRGYNARHNISMTSTTRTFGLILIVLGVASYFLTDRVSVTALIPAFFGAVFVILALVAQERGRAQACHARRGHFGAARISRHGGA